MSEQPITDAVYGRKRGGKPRPQRPERKPSSGKIGQWLDHETVEALRRAAGGERRPKR